MAGHSLPLAEEGLVETRLRRTQPHWGVDEDDVWGPKCSPNDRVPFKKMFPSDELLGIKEMVEGSD
jgi:hypothetical protein